MPMLDKALQKHYDLDVYNVKTGEKIFSLAKDFGMKNVSNFELEKDTLFFVENGRLYSAQFWPLDQNGKLTQSKWSNSTFFETN